MTAKARGDTNQNAFIFRLGKPGFFRFNGKFTLKAFVYGEFLNRSSGKYVI